MKIDIYSDIVCPWCYIGERRFRRAVEEWGEDVDVSFHAYQLDPGAPVEAIPLAEYLTARYGPSAPSMMTRVSGAAAPDGIIFDWDAAKAVNTRDAHRLLGFAIREHGGETQRALLEKLFELHFEKGADVSDTDTLTDAAAAVGMDADRVRAYLDSGEGEAELSAELAAARTIGIQAVPTFIFDDKYMVQGAQPAETRLQVLKEVAAKR